MSKPRSEMAYIGREPGCGCITVAVCIDAPPDAVIEALQEMRRYKLDIELVSNQYVRDNFRSCPHVPKQASLLTSEVPA
jgi:hypothetical protein